jgi:hypothetical protein
MTRSCQSSARFALGNPAGPNPACPWPPITDHRLPPITAPAHRNNETPLPLLLAPRAGQFPPSTFHHLPTPGLGWAASEFSFLVYRDVPRCTEVYRLVLRCCPRVKAAGDQQCSGDPSQNLTMKNTPSDGQETVKFLPPLVADFPPLAPTAFQRFRLSASQTSSSGAVLDFGPWTSPLPGARQEPGTKRAKNGQMRPNLAMPQPKPPLQHAKDVTRMKDMKLSRFFNFGHVGSSLVTLGHLSAEKMPFHGQETVKFSLPPVAASRQCAEPPASIAPTFQPFNFLLSVLFNPHQPMTPLPWQRQPAEAPADFSAFVAHPPHSPDSRRSARIISGSRCLAGKLRCLFAKKREGDRWRWFYLVPRHAQKRESPRPTRR